MDGFVGHGGRVGAALARHDRRVRPLAPLLELLDGCGPERVPGGEHRRSRQKARELAYGRGLARPVHPDIRMIVGWCETSSSTGPSSMLVACSIMSSRNSAPLVMFFSSASCSSSPTSFAVVGTP